MDAPVLLTGATGYIGGCLLRRFEDSGRAVRRLVRQPGRCRATVPATEIAQGDSLDEASLDRALLACSARVEAALDAPGCLRAGQDPGATMFANARHRAHDFCRRCSAWVRDDIIQRQNALQPAPGIDDWQTPDAVRFHRLQRDDCVVVRCARTDRCSRDVPHGDPIRGPSSGRDGDTNVAVGDHPGHFPVGVHDGQHAAISLPHEFHHFGPAVPLDATIATIWRLGSYRLRQNLLRRIPVRL